MKLLINACSLGILLLTISCERTPDKNHFSTTFNTSNQLKDEIFPNSFQTIIIDSCEYIVANFGYPAGVLTHKGNCKNPIHKLK